MCSESTSLTYFCAERKSSSNCVKYSQTWKKMCAKILLYLFTLGFAPGHASKESMLNDLQALSTTLPGCYSNVDQYYKHAQKGLPPEKRHFLLKAEIYKMASPMFNDSLTFYFQDFTKSSSHPFRSGFYSFSVESKMNVVRMKTFKLKNNGFIVGAFKKAGNFTLDNEVAAQVMKNFGRANGSLRTYGACDMFWKRLGDSTFAGVTGPLCLGSLGADQVRIGVAMTLTKERLLLTESWYKLSDGTQITEVKVPYILQKLDMPTTSKNVGPKSRLSYQERMSNDIDTSKETTSSFKFTRPWKKGDLNSQNRGDLNSQYKGDLNSQYRGDLNTQYRGDLNSQYRGDLNTQHRGDLNTQNRGDLNSQYRGDLNSQYRGDLNSQYRGDLYSHYRGKGLKYRKTQTRRSHNQNGSDQHRILRNFRQVAAALTSGHDVYFRVELSACSIPDQVRIDRVSFGGVIKSFVYVRQDGSRNERKDYIYFLSHKTVMGNQGPEFISRQLTLLREGRVKVEIIKTFSEPSKVQQMYAFDCRLYSDHKGYGGVKLALDPASHVKRINSFGTLSTAVDQGRDLHIVADLARCRGSGRKPAVVMGSQITNYDFVNGGKTVEIFIPFAQTAKSQQADVSTPVRGFMGQILKNGDVILTLISNSQSKHSWDNVFHLSPAYHCTLSNRNAVITNDENEHSVRLFYTK